MSSNDSPAPDAGAGVSRSRLLPLIPRLGGQTVLVIGDVFLDDYWIGRAERLSREAPIPVLEFEEQRLLPGGGANPAANIASLGSRPIQVGVVGDDAEGVKLKLALEELGIDPAGLVRDPGRPTTTKMRVVARSSLRFPQQLARIDRVDRRSLDSGSETSVVQAIRDFLPRAQAVLISDYRSGLCTPAVIQAAREAAEARGLTLTADSQGDLDKYHGFTLVKCNHAEAESYLGRPLADNRAYQAASMELVESLSVGAMLITRGEAGLTLASHSTGVQHIPAANVTDVFDSTGAGDTVIAVATLALAAGLEPIVAAALANHAAGVAIRHLGNHPVTAVELQKAVEELPSGPMSGGHAETLRMVSGLPASR